MNKIFKVTVKPYAIYTVLNLVFVGLAENNIGILNEDVACGLFVSWVINSFVVFCTVCRN